MGEQVCSENNNAGAPCLEETWDKSEKQNDPGTVCRVILTPTGEELAPPLEVWEEGEEPPHRAAAPAPHHPDCRCGQCPTTPENPGGPLKPDFGLSGEQDTPNLIEDDDEPYTFYEGDPIPPDPYAAEETEEERKQDLERREQILDKHKDRLDRVEKQYLYTPQLADRIRDEIQQIMELEMGPEAFSYQLLPPPAS